MPVGLRGFESVCVALGAAAGFRCLSAWVVSNVCQFDVGLFRVFDAYRPERFRIRVRQSIFYKRVFDAYRPERFRIRCRAHQRGHEFSMPIGLSGFESSARHWADSFCFRCLSAWEVSNHFSAHTFLWWVFDACRPERFRICCYCFALIRKFSMPVGLSGIEFIYTTA